MRILFVLILLFPISIAFSQTVNVPDVNLKNKLMLSYPQVMQGNQLDLSKAAALTGVLNLRNASISDATGIQYFTGITTLDITNNLLTTLPDISAITGLVNFYATNNLLTSLPDMSAHTKLVDFQVMNNKLTSLPNLSAPGLTSLYCSNNLITQLPPLTQFPALLNLVVGNNPIGNLDVSPCTNLLELHIHLTGADTIVGLEKLKKLTTIFAWGNEIRSFRALDSITTLVICVVYDNPTKAIPYLKNKPNLSTLRISHWFLTFEDIQPVLLQNPPATFTYSPQRTIHFDDVKPRAENVYAISYPVSSPLSGNKYVWMKDGITLDSSSKPSYTFNSLKFSDSGNYSLKVYNGSIPTLVIYSDTFNISVSPCIELKVSSVDILNKDCSKGYTVDLSQSQISGGAAPFVYELNNGITRKRINNLYIESIEAGKYFLTIKDSKNCLATDNFVLDKIDNCDPVITPNGDGIADTYFIEKSGKVSVYDLKRNLVNTLQAPIVWDGRDKNGALLDAGFYMLIIEEEKPILLTIIR
jgi:Leucine-rich repeat (LRR) protein